MFPSSDLARIRGPAAPAGSPVLRGPVGPAMSLNTLLPDVDVPGLCQIVLTVGQLPGVDVPLPAVWEPLFALSPVEELKKTGAAEVVGRRLDMHDGRSGPAVAGISAMVARAAMYAMLLNIGVLSDRAVGCPAWDGGRHREMVDDWTIYELTIYELMLVVVYMFCVYALLCIFCSQGFPRFASLSGVIPRKLVWGIVRSFLDFDHVRAGGGGGVSVTIMQYRFGLGWPTVGRGGLRALWRIDGGLSWPAVEEGGRLPR